MDSCYYVIIVILQSNKSLTTPLCLLIMPTLRNNETVYSSNTVAAVAPLLLCLTLVDMTVNQCCHRLIKQFCSLKRFPGWLKSSSTLFLKKPW